MVMYMMVRLKLEGLQVEESLSGFLVISVAENLKII